MLILPYGLAAHNAHGRNTCNCDLGTFTDQHFIQCIRGFGDNALFKSTFYLLTFGCTPLHA